MYIQSEHLSEGTVARAAQLRDLVKHPQNIREELPPQRKVNTVMVRPDASSLDIYFTEANYPSTNEASSRERAITIEFGTGDNNILSVSDPRLGIAKSLRLAIARKRTKQAERERLVTDTEELVMEAYRLVSEDEEKDRTHLPVDCHKK